MPHPSQQLKRMVAPIAKVARESPFYAEMGKRKAKLCKQCRKNLPEFNDATLDFWELLYSRHDPSVNNLRQFAQL